MEDEMKTLVRRNLELTRENNKLLKKIRRNGMIANIMRLVWWGVIVGVPLFLYYYVLQPYISELGLAYQGVTDGVSGAQNSLRNIPFIGGIFENFVGGEVAVPTE